MLTPVAILTALLFVPIIGSASDLINLRIALLLGTTLSSNQALQPTPRALASRRAGRSDG